MNENTEPPSKLPDKKRDSDCPRLTGDNPELLGRLSFRHRELLLCLFSDGNLHRSGQYRF